MTLGLNDGTGKLESWINNASQLDSTTAVSLGQWSHVALVYNGTNRTFYVNGVFAGSGNAPKIASVNDTSTIGNVVPNDDASFNGEIDEVSVYNRALSSDEIAAIYLAGPYGKCQP
jgi:MSHA biogenesis protein MshQ